MIVEEKDKDDIFLKEKGLFILDCETDGLYGDFLTAAVVVTDNALNVIEEHYWGVEQAIENAEEPWVKEHVIPLIGEYDPCMDQDELHEIVWQLWLKYRENCYAMADVAFPVENRFFAQCVEKDITERAFLAPFPLLDLSSILYQKGIDPLADRPPLAGINSDGQHNALFDVKMTVEIMKKLRGAAE